jgi:hypothetical protein
MSGSVASTIAPLVNEPKERRSHTRIWMDVERLHG